jgi:putative mRNA 3-end processing factor
VNLLSFTDRGIYCSQGGFYIDPWKPVDKAVITHAHSDHARAGCGQYLAHPFTVPLLRLRLGNYAYQALAWGETLFMNGVQVSLHPSGHMIGASQVRVEYRDEVWVVSGDYKMQDDGLSGRFEPIPCHTFITESTFGLPIYDWKPQDQIYQDIQGWVLKNKLAGKNSVLIAYSMGKAQRLLPCLAAIQVPIYLHGAVWNIHETLLRAGISLPQAKLFTPELPKELLKGVVIIAPQGADSSPWIRRFTPYETGTCSGWMQVRGNFRRSGADAGFALSDHADWKGLLEAIQATGAEKVFVTHGFQSALSRYLNEKGWTAGEVKTEFGEEEPAGDLQDEWPG